MAYLLRKLATFVRTFCKFACVCYLCTLGRHCLVFCKRGFPLMRMILYVMCSLVLFALANSHDCYCNLCRLCSQHCQFSCATFANMFFFCKFSHTLFATSHTLSAHWQQCLCLPNGKLSLQLRNLVRKVCNKNKWLEHLPDIFSTRCKLGAPFAHCGVHIDKKSLQTIRYCLRVLQHCFATLASFACHTCTFIFYFSPKKTWFTSSQTWFAISQKKVVLQVCKLGLQVWMFSLARLANIACIVWNPNCAMLQTTSMVRKKHVQTLCAHLQKWACASANFHCKFANSAWHFANVFLLQNLCLDICVANAVFAHPQLLCAFVQTLACKSAILHCKLAKLGLHGLFCKLAIKSVSKLVCTCAKLALIFQN